MTQCVGPRAPQVIGHQEHVINVSVDVHEKDKEEVEVKEGGG